MVAACASEPFAPTPKKPADAVLAECRGFLAALDRAVSTYAVNDAEAARVEGYPFLRTNRFLASFPPGTLSPDDFDEWLDRLQALDYDGRRVEVANLPPATREDLATRFAPAGRDSALPLTDHVAHCERLLRRALVDTPDLRVELAGRVTVPDDYRDWQRVIGLYPVTQIPFAVGVNAWQRETLRVFETPLDALPQGGDRVRYQPPLATDLSAAQDPGMRWHVNRLRIPEPPATDLQRLLLAHAPVLVVDTETADDRIGAIELDSDGRSSVATSAPVVYTYASYARWQGTVLLQLNYVFWFPARPAERTWDLLAGHLDGITWRVTLTPDGTVLVADTIHNCGCYHLFFPSRGLRPVVAYGAATEERPFTPQVLPTLAPGERIALHIAARTHYLQRVTATPLEAHATQTYALLPYDTLRSLQSGGERRMSLFGPDGVVPGTERGERFLFWPMGVPDPGAMRQRGRHATAFVGRRHFDDPWLLERSFEPVPGSAIIRVPRPPPEQRRDDTP